jgi:tetratricopeptide (TPR) repeat protein
MDQGHFDQAVGEFEEAVQVDPNFGEAWANLSWARYKSGRLNEVNDAAAKALALASGEPKIMVTALYSVGRVAETAGDYDKAQQAYQRVLDLKADHGPARTALETLLIVRRPGPDLLAATGKVLQGEILEDEDVAKLTLGELRVLRNGPYARHGKNFRDPGLNAYYYGEGSSLPMRLAIDPDFALSSLTLEDKANVKLFKLKEAELASSATGNPVGSPPIQRNIAGRAENPPTERNPSGDSPRPNHGDDISAGAPPSPTPRNRAATGEGWTDPFAQ